MRSFLLIISACLPFSVSLATSVVVRNTKLIPLADVIRSAEARATNKAEAWKMRDEKMQLARIYALAYASGDAQVPVFSDDNRPDFLGWVSGPQSGRKPMRHFPPKVKLPITPERQEYLQKASALYSAIYAESPTEPFVAYGLGWCLAQSGKHQEVRKVLGPAARDYLKSNESPLYAPSAIAHLPFPADARFLKVSTLGAVLNRESIFPLLVYELTGGPLQISGEGSSSKQLDWSKEARAYFQAPTDQSLTALVQRIETDVPEPTTKLNFTQKFLVRSISKKVLVNDIRNYHLLHTQGAGFLSKAIQLALTAQSPSECAGAVGAAKLAEGDIETKVLCVSRLAWKDKNWGYCRDAFRSLRSVEPGFMECVTHIAYRSQKPDLCKEIGAQLNQANISNFSEYECRQAALRKADKKTGPLNIVGPAFYSDSDWSLKDLRPGLGGVVVEVKQNNGKIFLEEVKHLRSMPKNAEMGTQNSYIISILQPESGRTETVEVKLEDATGKTVATTSFKLPMAPDPASYGLPPPTFSIADQSGFGEIMHVYVTSLDPQADKAEIEAIRRKLWINSKQNALLQSIDVVE